MEVKNITKQELLDMSNSGDDFELVDVREQDEWNHYYIKGAKLVPMSIFQLKVQEVDWSKKVVLYCNSGARSAMIARLITDPGRDVYNLSGGISAFTADDEAYLVRPGK
jgi:sulfur-carrier protein adenylyltransferase/sulfurtransferase